jgi:flagellar basal body-associated protein FliL
MIHSSKKIITIIIVFLFISGLVFIWYFTSKSQPQKNQESTEESQTTEEDLSNLPKIKKPELRSPYQQTGSYQIELQIPDTLPIPKSLSIYKIDDKPMTENDINTIAKNVGFTTKSAKSTIFTGQTIYSYLEGNKSLTVTPDTGTIDFSPGTTYGAVAIQKPITQPIDKEKIKTKIFDFLTSNKLVSNTDGLELTSVKLLPISDVGGHINPNIPSNTMEALFSKNFDNIPLLDSNSQSGTITVTLNADYEIVSLSVSNISNTTKLNAYPLKVKSEIMDALSEATLIDIANGKLEESDIFARSTLIKKIIVNQIALAYVPQVQKDNKLLEPILLLKGNAYYQDGANLPVTLQMPAISSKYFE